MISNQTEFLHFFDSKQAERRLGMGEEGLQHTVKDLFSYLQASANGDCVFLAHDVEVTWIEQGNELLNQETFNRVVDAFVQHAGFEIGAASLQEASRAARRQGYAMLTLLQQVAKDFGLSSKDVADRRLVATTHLPQVICLPPHMGRGERTGEYYGPCRRLVRYHI